MKNLLIASMLLASSVTANAGAVAYIAPDAVAFEEPARMGGSGAWLIPLVIVAVLVLALTSDDDSCSYTKGSLVAQPNPCTL